MSLSTPLAVEAPRGSQLPVPPLSTAPVLSTFHDDGGRPSGYGLPVAAAVPVLEQPMQLVLPRAGYAANWVGAESGPLDLHAFTPGGDELGAAETLLRSVDSSRLDEPAGSTSTRDTAPNSP